MGVSTIVIGMLPTYASIGTLAPLLLALCRFGQGLGLGGEWGGAVLLATENAPPGKRAWYGMFPQLGAPIGFFLSGGIFLMLSQTLDDAAVLRLGLAHSLPVERDPGRRRPVRAPENPRDAGLPGGARQGRTRQGAGFVTVFREHGRALLLGTLMATSTFVLFYLLTVFALSWGTTGLHYSRHPVPAAAAGRGGLLRPLDPAVGPDRRPLRTARGDDRRVVAIMVFGLTFGALFVRPTTWCASVPGDRPVA
jgi:MFS family permease